MIAEVIETDVLVVGGGGAGFRAAISAREKGAHVLLVNKGTLGKSGATHMAGADLTADGLSIRRLGFIGEARDSQEKFFSDIVHQGFMLNNQELVEIYVQEAGNRVEELINWGMKVNSSEERAVYTTGLEIAKTLLRKSVAMGIEMIGDMMILDLLVYDSVAAGALGLDINKGEFIKIKAKAIVLATGGWHKAYLPNAGSRDLSGDGIAIAYRAGADLANMEFVTFCSNILLWPPTWRGSLFTYILTNRIGCSLINREGSSFLDRYDPYVVEVGVFTEWNKCFLSIATAQEVIEGKGSPHGGVYYVIGDIPWEKFESLVLTRYPRWKYHGADFSELGKKLQIGEPVEVGPAAEYFEGGIVADNGFETGIKGLYAAGECVASLFGANRVAAATTEMLVSGEVAGRYAADYAQGIKPQKIISGDIKLLEDVALMPLKREAGICPPELRKEIQILAHEKLGPIRTRLGIEEFITYLENVKLDKFPALFTSSKSRMYNKEWIDALELRNMVQVLEISARSALMRDESRGVHFRADFPRTDNYKWLKEIVVRREGDRAGLKTRPISFTSISPTMEVVPYMEMMKKMMKAHSDIGGHH